MEFHKKVDNLRKQKGWKKSQLAREVGVSASTVGNWISGDRYPEWKVIVRLADVLGVTVDYLLRNELEVPPDGLTEPERAALKWIRRYGLTEQEVTEALLDVRRNRTQYVSPEDSVVPEPPKGSPPNRRNPKHA